MTRWLVAVLSAVGILIAVGRLQVSATSDIFTDATAQAGITWRHANGESGEKFLIEAMGGGVAFLDFDGDGLPDLFFVTGGETPKSPHNSPPHNALYRNLGNGKFVDVAEKAGLARIPFYGMGVAVADFDNDGRMDLFVANANAEPYLYHNTQSTGHHWAQFVLEGTKSNRTGVGAQVRLTSGGRTYLSFVNGGNGFGAQSTSRVHFGMGASNTIDRLEIRWPSGLKQVLEKLSADRIYKIQEGKAKTEVLVAKR